jgi:hypothetical protein
MYITSRLSENDWNFTQDIWDLLNKLWPQIEALQTDITGRAPEHVEAKPFRVRPSDWKSESGGAGMVIRGGYYPIAYDREEGRKYREISDRQAMNELFETQFTRAQTRDGHTKARAWSTGMKIRYDFGVIPEHLTNVIHDLAFRRAVIDADKLIRHEDVRDAVLGALGAETYSHLRPGLQ